MMMFTALAVALLSGGDATPREFQTGMGRFLVSAPDAASSAAQRINTDLVSKAGVVPPPTPGYTFTRRLIARAADGAALAAAARPLGSGVPQPIAGIPGFYTLAFPSVGAALDALAILGFEPGLLVEADVQRPRVLRTPSDPLFANQWHLKDGVLPVADANVEPVWDSGIFGTGVTIGIVEGGWQVTHPDLAANYNAAASQTPASNDSHGTACAGIAAAVANNGIGGVGAAYGAQLSRLVIGAATKTAQAFVHANDINDVKSNSWGPPDTGAIWGWSEVERAALEASVQTGRGGRGEVFTWAAGNGGVDDRVDYDPYASSRFTIAVGAIGADDQATPYNELGSSMMVVAASSGKSGLPGITTTTNNSGYISNFGGTSASSPLVAGVIALVLEANPDLTWRDVQHVLIRSARMCHASSPSWGMNAAGRAFSEAYGFGAIDAHGAVTLAQGWAMVTEEVSEDSGTVVVGELIPDNTPGGIFREVEVAAAMRVESVELILNATTGYIGDLRVEVLSPGGTVSLLAEERDDPGNNFVGTRFTSIRHWDEPAQGVWRITIEDLAVNDEAYWHDLRLVVYGTMMCEPDCEGDGDLDIFDFLCFQGRFAAMDPYADFERDGDWDIFDFLAFQNAFVAGCP